jgi:hypothetical protein
MLKENFICERNSLAMLYDDFVIGKLIFLSDEFKQKTVSIQLAKHNILLEKHIHCDYSLYISRYSRS